MRNSVRPANPPCPPPKRLLCDDRSSKKINEKRLIAYKAFVTGYEYAIGMSNCKTLNQLIDDEGI